MTSGEVGMVRGVEARVPVMGKLGIFQCNVILSVDGNMQYDSAFFGHSFFFGAVQEALDQSLVMELDPTCLSYEFLGHN